MKKIAVVFAFYWELRPLARRLGVNFFESLRPVITAKDGYLVLAKSGIGAERAGGMAEEIIKNFKPDLGAAN